MSSIQHKVGLVTNTWLNILSTDIERAKVLELKALPLLMIMNNASLSLEQRSILERYISSFSKDAIDYANQVLQLSNYNKH